MTKGVSKCPKSVPKKVILKKNKNSISNWRLPNGQYEGLDKSLNQSL